MTTRKSPDYVGFVEIMKESTCSCENPIIQGGLNVSCFFCKKTVKEEVRKKMCWCGSPLYVLSISYNDSHYECGDCRGYILEIPGVVDRNVIIKAINLYLLNDDEWLSYLLAASETTPST